MSAESLQTISSALIALGVVLTALGGFGQYYFGKRAETEHEQTRQHQEAQIVRERLSEAAAQTERLRRHQILAQLRQLYLLRHDGLTPEMIAGTAPLPKEWVEQQLMQRGETWRQNEYY